VPLLLLSLVSGKFARLPDVLEIVICSLPHLLVILSVPALPLLWRTLSHDLEQSIGPFKDFGARQVSFIYKNGDRLLGLID
jgi:hypothetical protein